MAAAVRLGVIVPSVNIVVEEWYPTAVPAGVSLHFARMLMPEGSSPQRIIEMDRTDGVRAIRQLATCRPHAIAYGCTAVEHRAGPRIRCASAGGDPRHRRLSRHQRDAQHLYRLREARLETGVAISPYTAEVDASEHRFFAEGGIEIIAGAHLGISDGFRLAEPSPEQILDLALGTWEPSADGMIVACLNFRSHPIIDELEARTGKPVVTSTQAVLWHALRLAGVSAPISGYGRLLREH